MSAALPKRVAELKAGLGAVILAHNYQRPEIQDVADFTGDSLELSVKARAAKQGLIVFCGVRFMAETAKILCPAKTVLLPVLDAGCPMADMVDAEGLREMKKQHPGAAVVCYVNSTAEVKAECDICCTSGNAVEIVSKFPAGREIIFVPDQNLGSHVEGRCGRKLLLWPGFCPTHARLLPEELRALKLAHPGAVAMAHPECEAELRALADVVLSTGGMLKHVRGSARTEFIVATEEGLLHRLRQENPGKTFIPASGQAVCPNMKKITLEALLDSLEQGRWEVEIPEDVRRRAEMPLARMLA